MQPVARTHNRVPREAVVLVHGIGEQQPMNTLLGFERALAEGHATFGAPDDVRDRTDQRKLKVTWNQEDWTGLDGWPIDRRERREANTDFFELYWAYQFRDTTLGHVWSWVKPLLRRPRTSVAGNRLLGPTGGRAELARGVLSGVATGAAVAAITGAHASAWGLVALAGLAALAGLLAALGLGLLFTVRMLVLVGSGATLAFVAYRAGQPADAAGGIVASLLGSVAIPAVTTAVVGGLTKSLGDAGRYLTNNPDNVQTNEDIRQDALELLDRLHEATEASGRYRYDRIIMVGHSLGSVIAYDVVRHFWARRNKGMNLPPDGSQDTWSAAVEAVERTGTALTGEDALAGPAHELKLAEFRAAQECLYRLLRDIRSTPGVGRESTTRWIISDLVTLGSPLTYADLLMATDGADLTRRHLERMLASCPPDPQHGEPAATLRPYRFGVTGERKATRLHHAAVFAPVRWTNLYFSHDLIGGPLREKFGHGVRDVELAGRSWPGWFLLTNPHSSYWRDEQALAELRALICRPPTVYLRMGSQPSYDDCVALEAALVSPVRHALAADQGMRAPELRLFVQERGRPRTGVWLPSARAPATAIDDESLPLPVHSGLAVSPDIRPGKAGLDEDSDEH